MSLSLLTKVADEIEKKEEKKGGKPPFINGEGKEKEPEKKETPEKKEAPEKQGPEEAGMTPEQEKQHEASETPQQEAAEEAAEGEGGAVPAEGAPVEGAPVATTPINIVAILDFLQQNPNPTDATFHQFAEGNGWDVHQAEAMMYGLATKAVNLLRGGMMIEKQLDIASVNPNELAQGTKVEFKHTTDESIAKKLALDNLAMIPDYYTRLQRMESEASAERDAAVVPMNSNMGDVEDGENEPQGQTNMPAYNVSTRDPD